MDFRDYYNYAVIQVLSQNNKLMFNRDAMALYKMLCPASTLFDSICACETVLSGNLKLCCI